MQPGFYLGRGPADCPDQSFASTPLMGNPTFGLYAVEVDKILNPIDSVGVRCESGMRNCEWRTGKVASIVGARPGDVLLA